MTKFAAFALVAGAALAATGAIAQPPAPPPAPPLPPRPGVTWHHPPMPGPMAHGPMAMHGPGHGHGAFPHRLQRGVFVPPFFFSPQFTIGNWQLYGFAAPGAGQRWIRYYDDAYLLDGDGRIVDVREGLDWDRYGEHWAMDGDVPYYGDGHGEDARVRTYVYGAPGYPAPPPPPPGYYAGYGAYGAYGYGYGYAYPIIVETTVSGGGAGYTEEVTEELVRVRTPHRARRAPRCICRTPAPRVAPRPRPAPRRAAPRPPAGERG